MKKNKFLSLLICFSILFTHTAFAAEGLDLLYLYQWGLKNYGNARIEKSVLSTNHNYEVFNYDKSIREFSLDNILINSSSTYNPTIVSAQIGNDIGFEEAYSIYATLFDKKEVIVAIIDTGVDINHFELKESIWVNTDEIPGNGIDDDRNGFIDDVNGYNFFNDNPFVYVDPIEDAHGTHAAGTIIAAHNNTGIKGIAYDVNHTVKIMPIKILGPNSKGTITNLYKAIDYAYNNGSRICNVSLGTYSIDYNLEAYIQKYPDMLFVVAAGNGKNFIGYNIDISPVYPASYNYPNVLTVSNLCFDGTRYESGNFGYSVDLFAPGTYILSTLPNDSFGYYTGTSMAAPYATAVAAMLMSSYKNLTVSQIRDILRSSVSVDARLATYSISSGRLNAFNAMTFAINY